MTNICVGTFEWNWMMESGWGKRPLMLAVLEVCMAMLMGFLTFDLLLHFGAAGILIFLGFFGIPSWGLIF
jgi:hypothetical protein